MISESRETTSKPWRVGVLFSRSGYMALIEETQFRGTMIAINEINAAGGVNGRELEPVVYDPASDNSLFKLYARRMLADDRLTTIFGCYTSSSRKAVLPVIERLNGLLWYPTIYEGFEYSPNVIHTGAAPNQNIVFLSDFLMSNFGRRVYFVGSDYIYPRASNRIMRELFKRGGGEVVGETYVPLNAKRQDFYPVMRRIRDRNPDVIFSTVVGQSTVYFYQCYNDYNLNPAIMPIASLTTTETEISAMGGDVGAGHLTAAPYFQCVEGGRNRSFVHIYQKLYGDDQPTNMCIEAAYFQVHMFAEALKITDTMEPDILRPVVLGQRLEAPQGMVSMDPASSHANVWSRIGRANQTGQFDILQQSAAAVLADPYMVSARCAMPG